MISERARRVRRAALATVAGLLMAGCGPAEPRRVELRLVTEDFVLRVSPETRPTRALEPVYWRVVVHDVKTGLPIQGGQGRIFATNQDRKTVSNGLEETDELGTYRSHLMYVTAGMWAMAVQFRRDSTQVLQKTVDWTQDILTADEPGDFTTPTSVPVTPPASAAPNDTAAGSAKRPQP